VLQAQPDNRDAVGAIYDSLAMNLRAWTLWQLAATLLVLTLTLVWGRLGIVAGVRRGVASARDRTRRRREEAAMAQVTAEGTEVTTPVAGESWTQRVAAGTRAFAEGLELPERTASLGAYVRDHFTIARWTGIAVGAVVLLFWPDPTLSVLIWIAALVGLWLGALEWLLSRAPEQAAADGEPRPGEVAQVSADGSTPPVGASGRSVPDGAAGGPLAVPERTVPPAPRAPEPLVPAALTPAAMSALNDRLDLLIRLGAARDGGVLSEEEFGREKSRLLGV
jgi:hypothetical protein